MDSLERLLLYRKKLILPRIYQVINWFMLDYVFLRNPVFGYFGL